MQQIVMISYYRPNDFRKSIESILEHTEDYKLSIIDNSNGRMQDIISYTGDNITIYNNENLGKGKSFMKYYNTIMDKTNCDSFISIDADICVGRNWLTRLIAAKNKVKNFGIIAPVIMNNKGQYFEHQLEHGFIMHNASTLRHVVDEVYYNRHVAGCLLLIDRCFFESVGGFAQDQLYGNDDGELCKAAYKLDKFIGIASNVHVEHSNIDSDIGYKTWKFKNIGDKENKVGYWDSI